MQQAIERERQGNKKHAFYLSSVAVSIRTVYFFQYYGFGRKEKAGRIGLGYARESLRQFELGQDQRALLLQSANMLIQNQIYWFQSYNVTKFCKYIQSTMNLFLERENFDPGFHNYQQDVEELLKVACKDIK